MYTNVQYFLCYRLERQLLCIFGTFILNLRTIYLPCEHCSDVQYFVFNCLYNNSILYILYVLCIAELLQAGKCCRLLYSNREATVSAINFLHQHFSYMLATNQKSLLNFWREEMCYVKISSPRQILIGQFTSKWKITATSYLF